MNDPQIFGTIGVVAVTILLLTAVAFAVSHLGWKIGGLAIVALLALTPHRLGFSVYGMLAAGYVYIVGVRWSERRRRQGPWS